MGGRDDDGNVTSHSQPIGGRQQNEVLLTANDGVDVFVRIFVIASVCVVRLGEEEGRLTAMDACHASPIADP